MRINGPQTLSTRGEYVRTGRRHENPALEKRHEKNREREPAYANEDFQYCLSHVPKGSKTNYIKTYPVRKVNFVRGRGLEPPHLAAYPPQGYVYTNFTTRAFIYRCYLLLGLFLFSTFFCQKQTPNKQPSHYNTSS